MRALVHAHGDWAAATAEADPAAWLVLHASWSAVEPRKGSYDLACVEADRRALITARKRGVDVIVVTHAGALPDWQIARDGWMDADALAGFGCYVDQLAHAWGELVRHWIGLWEPLREATMYGPDQRRVARRLLDAQASASLHLRKAPGPGGAGAWVGVAERFDVPTRRRDQLIGRAPEAHALIGVLGSGRLAPPFAPVGELPNGTPAIDFTLAIQPTTADLHRIWRTARPVFVLGDEAAAQRAVDEGVDVRGHGPA